MNTTQARPVAVGTRRPRGRRAQILAAAASQFGRVGYSNASISEIADAVGITPGAVYRHFRNKEALLAELTLEGSARFVEIVDRDDADLSSVLSELAAFAVSRRDIGVLWQREARNLPHSQRVELGDRQRFCRQAIAELVGRHRPLLGAPECRLLSDALIAVLLSPSYHRAQIPSDRFREMLDEIMNRVVDVHLDPVVAAGQGSGEQAPALLTRRSRREILLGKATELFAERGYHAVTMDEIGHAAGMAGASVYNHFAKKDDILVAALNRGADMLDVGLNSAFAHATSASHALRLALVSYAEMMTDHPALVTIVVNETPSLTGPLRQALRSRQRDYVGEWVHLMGMVRPDADLDELRATVLAAITLVNIVVDSSPGGGDHVKELVLLGGAVLGLEV